MSLRVGVSSVGVALALVGSQALWAQPPQQSGGRPPVNPAAYQYPYQPGGYQVPPYCPPPPGYPYQTTPAMPPRPGMPSGQQPSMEPPRDGQPQQQRPQQPSQQQPTQQQPTAQTQQPNLQAPEAANQSAGTGLGQGLTSGAGGFDFGGAGAGDGGASDALASTAGSAPGMLGDFVGYTGTRLQVLRSNTTQVITQRVANGSGGFQNVNILYNAGDPIFVAVPNSPIASRVAFKIVEDECPAPQDRFFIRFNYYNDALRNIPAGTDAADFNSVRRLDLYREVIGFEKTLWGDCFSIGVRVPFIQIDQTDNNSSFNLGTARSFDTSDIGDISVVLKAVVVRDPCNGSLISAGCVFTFPTGPQTSVVRSDLPLIRPISGSFSSSGVIASSDVVLAQDPRSTATTLIQPWLGFFLDCGCGFVQGFSSITLPIHSDDIHLLFNSIAVGYYLCDGITPVLEFHLTNPVEKHGFFGDPIGFPDLFVMTVGSHFSMSENCDLSVGLAIPMTGNSPYAIEGIAELNFRF